MTTLRRLLALALLSSPLAAQTTLSGLVYDGNGGPLLAGNVYHTSGFTVPVGQTLTLQPGAVLKGNGALLSISGALFAVGTAGAPIRITSIFDDSVGGDTNGDGPSSGAPGDWRGFNINTSGTASFQHVVFEFGGGSGTAPIQHFAGNFSVANCTFARSLAEGIDLRSQSNLVPISACTFVNNGTYPIEGASVAAIANMSANTATGHGSGNYAPVRQTNLAYGTIGRDNLIGDVLVLGVEVAVQNGLTLTLERGVVVKWLDSVTVASRRLRLSPGSLVTRGTADEPVVFTSFADDEYGGDTNGNGASTGSPGSWARLDATQPGSTLDLEHTLVRFGGGPNTVPLLVSSTLRLAHVTVSGSRAQALLLAPTAPIPDVHECSFLDNGTFPVDGLSLEQLQGFGNNRVDGNGTSDSFRVTEADVLSDVVISPQNYPNRVLLLATVVHVRSGASLTLKPGVMMKAHTFSGVYSDGGGELILAGTAFEPVVLTSYHDDTWGGDTNKNGNATSPAPSDNAGFQWGVTATTSATGYAENVVAAYSSIGFLNYSPNVRLRSIRANRANSVGIRVDELSGAGVNWVAFGCAIGIQVLGDYNLYHATTVGNSNIGILTGGGTSGQIVNTISWGNGTNYSLVGAQTVTSSNGTNLAGGNLNANPLFVDQAGGNLNLQAGSPCIDTANYATATLVIKDHDEFSRLLDPTLSGNLRADMGAYEHHRWRMDVTGEPRIGNTMILQVTGPAPGYSLYRLSFASVPQLTSPVGYSMIGSIASQVGLGVNDVNTPNLIRIPRFLGLVGLEIRIQALTLSSASPVRGEWNNLYRACILPLQVGKPRLLSLPPEFTP